MKFIKCRRFSRFSISLFIALFTASACFAAPTKLRVNDHKEATRLLAHGGRLIADYGSFQIIEADESAMNLMAASSVESAEESNFIELNAKRLDTRVPEVKSLRKMVAGFAGKRLHLIQFVGPTKPEWLEAMEATGVVVVHYVPENAYLVRGNASALANLQSWASTADFVQWEGTFEDDYKVHPKARPTDAKGNLLKTAGDTYTIQLLEDADVNPETRALIDKLKLAAVEQEFQTLHYLNIVVRLPAEALAQIAAQSDVISIQPRPVRHKMDERQGQIMAGNLSGSVPSGPGYLTWLASRGFTQAQFSASGFAVDVSDSGVDNGSIFPGHFGLYQSGDPNLPSRVVYSRLEGFPNSPSTTVGCDGHGNLNAHIVGAYNDRGAGFPHTDSSGYHYGLGICPFVKIGSSVVFDDEFTNPTYRDLASRAYRDAARISNNSWGSDTFGDYDADSQAYDALVRDSQPSGSAVANSGNQQMVFVFSAGNSGSSASTVGSPGTAKNVICVGAAENVHSHSTVNGGNSSVGNDGCGTADSGANSANDIIGFSSRGPCTDGRQKPDLVAPGTHITGGVAQSVIDTNGNGTAVACFNGLGVCALPGSGTTGNANNFFPLGQQFYTTSSGTSHSSPGVAGGCALLRQYFINIGSNAPSPAMTKAFLINTARYMTGSGANDTLPSPSQGMGSVNLGTAFDGVPRLMRDQLSADKFTASGQTRIVTGRITDTSKPFRVTLAWTDAAGSTVGNAYNNNLDLTVTIGGNTYKGNVFSGSTSITGGSADAKNNLESVFLPAGTSGSFVVTVTGANINSDGVPNESPTLDQDYALVMYNAVAAPGIQTQPQSRTVGQGDSVIFSVVALGDAPLAYHWYFNSNPLADATNSNYNIASAQGANSGNYFVVVTNSGGSATSTVANLFVAIAPVVVTNPTNLVAVSGSTAIFTVGAVGAPTLNYQWRRNGTNIADATASAYSKSNVQVADGGSYTVVVTNSSGSVTSAPAVLTVTSSAASGLVISQIYGGGGLAANSPYRNDYVELHNPNGTAAGLAGWSVQYASASGSTWIVVNLSGSIPADGYYLVQLGSSGANGAFLPTADIAGSVNISASNGKVALVTNQTALTVSNPVGGSAIADFVGYGTANAFEGAGAAAAGANDAAIFRKNGGDTDTQNNAADFLTATPNPRNTSFSNVPASAPVLSPAGVVGNQFQFTVNGTVSSNYVVEVSTNLSSGIWMPIHTNAAPFLFSEPATSQQRYYRGSVAH